MIYFNKFETDIFWEKYSLGCDLTSTNLGVVPKIYTYIMTYIKKYKKKIK